MVVKEVEKEEEEEEESESEKDELHVAYTASELRSSRLILQNFTWPSAPEVANTLLSGETDKSSTAWEDEEEKKRREGNKEKEGEEEGEGEGGQV